MSMKLIRVLRSKIILFPYATCIVYCIAIDCTNLNIAQFCDRTLPVEFLPLGCWRHSRLNNFHRRSVWKVGGEIHRCSSAFYERNFLWESPIVHRVPTGKVGLKGVLVRFNSSHKVMQLQVCRPSRARGTRTSPALFLWNSTQAQEKCWRFKGNQNFNDQWSSCSHQMRTMSFCAVQRILFCSVRIFPILCGVAGCGPLAECGAAGPLYTLLGLLVLLIIHLNHNL